MIYIVDIKIFEQSSCYYILSISSVLDFFI